MTGDVIEDRSTPDQLPCPRCGVVLRDAGPPSSRSILDQSAFTTPLARLLALASEVGMMVEAVSREVMMDLAGAVSIGYDEKGEARSITFLAEDLGDELRADVLAFAIALFAAEPDRISAAPDGFVGIGSQRRSDPGRGTGHLAWHMARSCGRETSSTTFDVITPPVGAVPD